MKKQYFKALIIKAVLLTAILPQQGNAQDVYTVESIPYRVYETSLPIEFTTDDVYTDVLSLPFDFTFFDNTYNEFLVSTNGYIDFRTELGPGFSEFAFESTIPNIDFPVKNSILGCYHDMDNSTGIGTITWSVTGDAPYRQAVFMYNNQPHFLSSCNEDNFSTFQIIIYETLNFIDVQITQKDLCIEWNNGVAVVGLINDTGELGYAAPGRNTGQWEVAPGDGEGWRFKPEVENIYRYIKCDENVDGFEVFDLTVVQSELPASTIFYPTLEDAEQATNAISGTEYTNTVPNEETIYAAFNDEIMPVILSMVDCSLAFDNDTVATLDEDLNNNGNLADDDTDGDGLPNFADNDDDGDLVLTSEEYVFGRNTNDATLDTDNDGIPNYLDNDDDNDGILTLNEDINHNGTSSDDDTDNDGIPNFLDDDDDNDGVLTINEDYNENGDPSDDDTDMSGTPDYLESNITMVVNRNVLEKVITIYPNPASSIITIDNPTGENILEVSVYTINGVKVKQTSNTKKSINIADLQNGMYLIKIQVEDQVLNYKFIKK